jgi:hypothetical protein
MILFPVAIRFTALAVATNLGMTAFGSTGPYASTWLVENTGSPMAPAYYLAAAAVAGLLAATFGLRPRPSGEESELIDLSDVTVRLDSVQSASMLRSDRP